MSSLVQFQEPSKVCSLMIPSRVEVWAAGEGWAGWAAPKRLPADVAAADDVPNGNEEDGAGVPKRPVPIDTAGPGGALNSVEDNADVLAKRP